MKLLTAWTLVGMAVAGPFEPARLRIGSPGLPMSPHVMAGGEVLLEIAVPARGAR